MNLKDFDSLPDSALVPITAFRTLAGIAPSTVWRRASLEPDFPQPIRLGPKCTRFSVRAIRAFLSGQTTEQAASAKTNRQRLSNSRHA